jgi:hypothetical protein
MRLVDDTAARSDRRLETRLDALTRDRHVDVHRMAQWLGLVELLHPDCRSVSKGVDRIVFRHRDVTEDRAPKTDVNHIAFRRDGHLHFLYGRTIRDRTLLPRSCRNGARELDVPWFEIPDVTTQPDGHTSICES